MTTPLRDLVTVSALDAFTDKARVDPGDLSAFAPDGFGAVMPVIRPWDDPNKPADFGKFYGFQPGNADPIKNAPATDDAGGTIYFRHVPWETFETVLKVIGILSRMRTYVVLVQPSENVEEDRYLVQMRIVTGAALSGVFGVRGAEVPEQPVEIGPLIQAFLDEQLDVWNPERMAFPRELSGIAGGDGDWAKEGLAFGLTVENRYWGIYRVWSRAWLVTK